jgi:hypothetical protein
MSICLQGLRNIGFYFDETNLAFKVLNKKKLCRSGQDEKAEKLKGEKAETEKKKQHSLLEERRRKRDDMRKTRVVR